MRLSLFALGIVSTLGLAACSTSNGGGTSGGSSGSSGDADGGSSSGSSGASSSGGVKGPAIPEGTFLFTRRVSADAQHLVARDLATGAERVVTDLTSDGSKGWDINGFALSPDRTQVVLASIYGPTEEDNRTMLATQRIWLLDTEGKSFTRLTPVFKNSSPGTAGFRIDVRSPVFSKDGKTVYYQYGEQVIGKSGGSRTWAVSTDGSKVPDLLETPATCGSASPPTVNPATGDVLLAQGFCQNAADQGLVIFKADGQAPQMFVAGEDFPTSPVRWAADGSLFLYASGFPGSRSLSAYIVDQKKTVALVQPPSGSDVLSGALSRDGNAIVYCMRTGDAYDLRILDLSKDPVEDRAITTDGRSCDPVF